MKKYIAFIVVGLCFFSTMAYAEGIKADDTQGFIAPLPPNQNLKEQRQKIKEDVKQKLQTEKDTFRTQIEAIKAEAKTKKDTEMATLKAKLAGIKDAKKQATVTTIAEGLTLLNTKTTDFYAEKIAQMEKVLGNIITRTDKAGAKGLDVTAVRAKIIEVQTSIASTKTAIATQAAKTYPINVTTENNLRTATKTARDLLKADLDALKTTVKGTRDVLQSTATTLAQIKGVDKVETNQ